jgi:hypothetical protein
MSTARWLHRGNHQPLPTERGISVRQIDRHQPLRRNDLLPEEREDIGSLRELNADRLTLLGQIGMDFLSDLDDVCLFSGL